MTQETTKNSFPLWAKILIGIIGIVVLGMIGLATLGIVSFSSFNTTATTVLENTNKTTNKGTDLSSLTPQTMNTEQVIKDYLEQSNNSIDENQIVAKGDTINVDYIGRLNEYEVFDTSIQSVAEAAGSYNPQRNYEEGLSFTVGAGQMIAGFDEAVVGMKVGETKTVSLTPEKAYGKRDENLIIRVPLEEAGDTSEAQVGMKILLGGMYPAVITEITDTEIVFDLNHELAGKTLIFDITIKAITTKA